MINGKTKMIPCPAGNTESLVARYFDFKRNGCTQQIGYVRVLSYSDYSLRAKHHGSATWVEGPIVGKKPYKETKLKMYLRDNRAFEFVEKNFGKQVTNIYTFFVYDFLEMGIRYYLKRLISKITNKD